MNFWRMGESSEKCPCLIAGISRITSHLDPVSMMLPAVVVTALFYGFAWLIAGRIKKTGAEILIVE